MWGFIILIYFAMLGYNSTVRLMFNLYENDTIYYPCIHSKEGETRPGCVSLCYGILECVYFGFNAEKKLCKLYDRHINSWQTLTVKKNEQGWKIFDITSLEQNIAVSKYATSSSVYKTYVPSKSVDQDVSTFFETNTGDYSPWILIDLEAVYTVDIIVIYKDAYYPELLHDVNYEFYMEDPHVNPAADPYCCASTIGFYTTGRTVIRCSPNTSGRFLKIYSYYEYLKINELEIYPSASCGINSITSTKCRQPIGGENIALYKSTSVINFNSNGTVDGNRDNRLLCVSTGSAVNPSWVVDLENQYEITSVTIYSRSFYGEVDAARFSNITIYVYPDQFDPSAVCVYIPGVFGRTKRTLTCTNTTFGRYVRIGKPTPELAICEVEVTGIEKLP